MRIIVFAACFLLLLGFFGCLGQEQGSSNTSNTTQVNQTNNGTVRVIIGQQQNQTNIKNQTQYPEQNTTPPEQPKELEYTQDLTQPIGVYFINVGGLALHGDAILIKKGDLDVLVDAGPAEKGSIVVDFLRAHGVDDIEVMVSTNVDPRHYGGINTVADNFRIEEFWWNGDSLQDADYIKIVNRMTNSTKTVRKVEDGFSTELNGIVFKALNPPKVDKFDDVNNDAIVFRVTDRNFSILLTSGIQTGAQGKLINEKTQDIKTDIIQAPYYGVGAGTSNIGIFLITAKPEAMIISGSSDESAINGGSREPYKRLMQQYGIKWYENYINGTIRVTSDGQSYSVQSLGS